MFGQADPEYAARLDVILPVMEDAAHKLRENMDKVQQEIDSTLIRLQRSVLTCYYKHVSKTSRIEYQVK